MTTIRARKRKADRVDIRELELPLIEFIRRAVAAVASHDVHIEPRLFVVALILRDHDADRAALGQPRHVESDLL